MKTTTIEVGDLVIAANGPTIQLLFDGSYYYDRAVCVSVNPFILISEDGDMRWSTKKIEDFVSKGKAPFDVQVVCMNRLQQDINSGDVTGIVIGPISTKVVNFEKEEPVLKNIPLSEEKEVWMRAWVAAKMASNTLDECKRSAKICVQQYIQEFVER